MPNQTNEMDEWEFKVLQTRYKATYGLDLTLDQAIQIHKYEQERDVYSNKHFFSVWEEWDYEQTTFSQILNNEQLKNYEALLKENIKRYEQSLIELDGENSNEISYYEELINFYETQFLPDFFNNPYLLHFGRRDTDRAKVDFLRTEYKNFLNDTKKEILTSHFRHNRTFKPNELKLSLLRHKILCIFPDYSYFKHQMDEPTKAVAHYLKSKLLYLPDEIAELLTRKFNQLNEFNDTIFKKYHNDIRGWHVVMRKLTDEEEKEHRIITLLLLDSEKYGC